MRHPGGCVCSCSLLHPTFHISLACFFILELIPVSGPWLARIWDRIVPFFSQVWIMKSVTQVRIMKSWKLGLRMEWKGVEVVGQTGITFCHLALWERGAQICLPWLGLGLGLNWKLNFPSLVGCRHQSQKIFVQPFVNWVGIYWEEPKKCHWTSS